MNEQEKDPVPPAVSEILSKWGSKGGKKGSKEDKSRAGKLGHAALMAKLAKQKEESHSSEQPEPEPEPTEPAQKT